MAEPGRAPWPARDRCAIVGVGETDYTWSSGRSVLALAAEAARAAIADAGLEPRAIDGIVRFDLDEVAPNDLAMALGIGELSYWGSSGFGGAAPGGMVGQAVGALLTGQATNVLVFRSLNGRSGTRYGHGLADRAGEEVGGRGTFDEHVVPHGFHTPAQLFALLARRHMLDFGTTQEQLGAIAVACGRRAKANPRAQARERDLTLDSYLASPMVTSPLRTRDCCLETDGAAAAVITTADRAADLRRPPVLVRAVAQGEGPVSIGGPFLPAALRRELLRLPSATVATRLYRRAGLGPGEIDVAQLYDCFTITVLLQLEDYGFCARGEGGPFAESGEIEIGGSLPINTSGGHLAEGYLHGMNHLVEGVRQLRGTSTAQVAGAETCLVTSGLPVGTSAVVLRRP